MTPYRKLHVSKLKRAKEAAKEIATGLRIRRLTCPHVWRNTSNRCQLCGLPEWALEARIA